MLHFLNSKEVFLFADQKRFSKRYDELNAKEELEACVVYLRDRTDCPSCGESSARDFKFCPWCAWEKGEERK